MAVHVARLLDSRVWGHASTWSGPGALPALVLFFYLGWSSGPIRPEWAPLSWPEPSRAIQLFSDTCSVSVLISVDLRMLWQDVNVGTGIAVHLFGCCGVRLRKQHATFGCFWTNDEHVRVGHLFCSYTVTVII